MRDTNERPVDITSGPTQPNPEPAAGLAEQARALYARMRERLEAVRAHCRRPLTLADKLLFGHLEDPSRRTLEPGRSLLRLRPDRVVLQDVLGQTAMLQFAQLGRSRVALPTSIHCDHLIQAREGAAADLRASKRENDEVYDFLRSAAARYGAGFWEPGAGIIHQVVLETYAFPGALILGTDSHTPNAGGLAACAVGVGGADAVEAMAGLAWDLLYPRRIAVVLEGRLEGWTAPKDVILWVAGQLTTSGATNAVIEYVGPGAETLSATGKATIANMGAEVGATTSMFPADDAISAYLVATGRPEAAGWADRHRDLLAPDREVLDDPEAHYDEVLRLDLSSLEPQIVGPHSPDRVRPLSALAREIEHGDGDEALVADLSAALIGSCTNSSYQDMGRAAEVAEQARARGLRAQVPLWVAPGSARTRATIERDGQLDALRELGATVLASACGPCIGQWRRSDADGRPNSIVTSFNRNFRGRNDGQRTTQSFIASPEVVVALAVAGTLAFDPRRDALVDPRGELFRFDPPLAAPALPGSGYARADDLYRPPPADGRHVELVIDPESERLQALAPWPAWDGRDLVEMPILIKTRGRTTTDQISPAGDWLRYRGHLERFSDNLLVGAIDAFSGGTRDDLARRARAWRAEGRRWVIIGDANYGEGSSREHAALSPRLLGCAAVIARSFARIHESNLQKQGILALCFGQTDDYTRIGSSDRVSLVGLADLAEGRPVTAVVHREDGSSEELALTHSYRDAQLEWFRAGSALNAIGGAPA